MTMLLAEAIATAGTDVLEHLDRQVEIPVIRHEGGAPGFQGDVSVLPVTTAPASTPLPKTLPVVRGENGGNTHALHPSGPGVCFDFAPERAGSLAIGTLTVPDGAQALLSHPEHGYLAIDPGTYRIGRQREYAGEWRAVAD